MRGVWGRLILSDGAVGTVKTKNKSKIYQKINSNKTLITTQHPTSRVDIEKIIKSMKAEDL